MDTKYYDKYEKAIEKYYNTIEKYNPTRVTSAYITCRECGSKLNREVFSRTISKPMRVKCPVCSSDKGLYSKTANTVIEKSRQTMEKAKDTYEKKRCMATENNCKANKSDYAAAVNQTRDRFDYVIKEFTTPDFLEIHGKIGGDYATFRVYKDGSVYEK